MSPTDQPTHHLFDANTADDLGTATPEQVAASDETATKDGGYGIILIDGDGDVVAAGSFLDNGIAHLRRVYTEVPE